MKARRFSIPTLALAGLLAPDAEAGPVPIPQGPPDMTSKPKPVLFDVFRRDHGFYLAAHRSHSSHSSHRSSSGGGGGHSSHSSHRSSTGGGGIYRPAPAYTLPSSRNRDSTPPSTVLPSSPATAPKTLRGSTAAFKDIVRRVQIALAVRNYYSGAIDGVVGPETRASLLRFQSASSLPLTGTITSEVLDALGVAAR